VAHGFGERFVANPDAEMLNDALWEEEVMPGSVKVQLNGITRVHRGGPGEYILYSYTLHGKTQHGNHRNLYKTEGKWKKPIFVVAIDEITGRHQEIDKVEGFEDIWEIPYSPERVKQIMALDEMNSNFGMHVKKGEDSGVRSYLIEDRDRFINEPFDKLYPKEY
jgi:hypothetical protein